jgi:hypothetical protein
MRLCGDPFGSTRMEMKFVRALLVFLKVISMPHKR